MKKKCWFFLLSCTTLFIFHQESALADPYIRLCFGSQCDYYSVSGPYYRCSTNSSNTVTFYATTPDNLSCALNGTYQWYKLEESYCIPCGTNCWGWGTCGVAIDGAISNSYTVTEAGDYYCVVNCGGDDFHTDTIPVYYHADVPVITSDPASVAKCQDLTASFSCSYDNHSSVLWQEKAPGGDWSTISGETSDILDILAAMGKDQYQYRCSPANTCGRAYSAAATLDVLPETSVISHPAISAICEDGTANFNASASGDAISYQWRVSEDGMTYQDLNEQAPYSGTQSQHMVIDPAGESLHMNRYRCRITGSCGILDSDFDTLVLKFKPDILSGPSDTTACSQQLLELFVSASGHPPLSYAWYKDDQSLSEGVDQTSYQVASIDASDAGFYKVKVSNECTVEGISSASASIQVKSLPEIISNPIDMALCQGDQSSVNFSASASGSDLGYFWQLSENSGGAWRDLNDSEASYTNTRTLTLSVIAPDTSLDDNLYRLRVAGYCEPDAYSGTAKLEVNIAPDVISHPTSAEVCVGAEVNLNAEASGSEPLQYLWKKDGSSITAWRNDPELLLSSVSLEDAGMYKMLVRNNCTDTPLESDDAQLIVNPLPGLNLGPDQHLCSGESMVLDAGADYSSYQWSTGETSRQIEVSEQGSYLLAVVDQNGCENSDTLFVELDPELPSIDLGPDGKFCPDSVPLIDAGSGFDSYAWSDGSNGQTLTVLKSGKYWITATKDHTVCLATDTVEIDIIEPYHRERLCIVTVDMVTGKNLVVWEKTPDVDILSYNIYRESTIGVYEPIANVAYDALSVYRDTSVSPENRSYLYKITTVDRCGNESDLDSVPYHKPIFLSYLATENGVKLEWTDYKISGVNDIAQYLTSYDIYRGTSPTTLDFYRSAGSINDYLDTDPQTKTTKFYYRVAGVLKTPCLPTASVKAAEPISNSMSNLEDNGTMVGIAGQISEPLTVYPNPFTDFTTIRFRNPEHKAYRLILVDISGKRVRIVENICDEEVILHRNDLRPGIYQLQLAGSNIHRAILVVE